MNNRSMRIVLVIAAAMLWGCSTLPELRQSLEAKASCCSSMSEFKYDALVAESPFEFLLTEQSPVFAFPTGKSYYKAFSLPARIEGRKLRVSSRPTGSIAFETGKYSQSYCPRVLFLDEAFTELSVTENIPTYSRGFWSSAFVSQVEIPASAKYVVLHTNPDRYGVPTFRYTSGGAYMVGSAVVIDRGGEAIRHPCGPVADAVAEIL